MPTLAIDLLKKKYDFRSQALEIIISGRSSVDSTQGFLINTIEDADAFIKSYGFDLENPIESAEALGNFHESLNFIRRYFLQPENPEGLKLDLPRKILELTDIRLLLILASGQTSNPNDETPGATLKNWACSILKVMHTVAHVNQDLRTTYFSDVQQQIFDRFYRYIHRDDTGSLYLGERADDPWRVNLVEFQTKPKKTRDSTLLKLLHKPENVAEDIFDRVGIRFVTHTRLDALRVVKFLRDKMVVMAPNIKPSRSRNTLVELDFFKKKVEEIFALAEKEEISESRVAQELEEATTKSFTTKDNPFTSDFYRSIQFTARQLIKLKNPLYNEIKEIKSQAKAKAPHEELAKLIDRLDMKYIQRENRFFYPYEVQIVDVNSNDENELGRSAHSEYKKAQLLTAMKRVMGNLMASSRDAVR